MLALAGESTPVVDGRLVLLTGPGLAAVTTVGLDLGAGDASLLVAATIFGGAGAGAGAGAGFCA
jgi:hypothetical protein